MSQETRLTGEQIRDVIDRLAGLDLGGWTRAEVERAVATCGWSVAEGEYGPALVTGLADGGSVGTGLNGSDDEVFQLSVPVARTRDRERQVAAFQEARGIAEERFWPAAWRGGRGYDASGPWIRWRRPGASVELGAGRYGVDLTLFSTDQVDRHEYLFINQGQGLDDLPHRWFGVTDDADRNMNFFPGDHRAAGWEEFEGLLADTLEDLVHDVPYFGDLVILALQPQNEDDPRYVQLWIDGEVLHLEASNASPEPDPAWAPALTGLGWVPPESHPNWTREFQGPGRAEAETAARLLVGALRTFGVPFSGLRARKSMRGTYWFGLPALGAG